MPENQGLASAPFPAGILSATGKLSEEEADRARALLAAIVQSSEDAIVSKTLDGIVTSWNESAERLFGFTAHEMIGEPITRIIPKSMQHEELEILAKLHRGERIERYETIRVRKDGQPVDVSLAISPVRDSANQIVGAAKVAHDITPRRTTAHGARGRTLKAHGRTRGNRGIGTCSALRGGAAKSHER